MSENLTLHSYYVVECKKCYSLPEQIQCCKYNREFEFNEQIALIFSKRIRNCRMIVTLLFNPYLCF